MHNLNIVVFFFKKKKTTAQCSVLPWKRAQEESNGVKPPSS
jgi:hypothetical protein